MRHADARVMRYADARVMKLCQFFIRTSPFHLLAFTCAVFLPEPKF
jgi:hypothetical protein